MSLFRNKINIETGQVFSLRNPEQEVGTYIDKHGYHGCTIKDCYGNSYGFVHDVIIAEGLQLPKHLWPVDENGNRYIVDHIIPVSNGGTNEFSNLRLIPKHDNSKNSLSKINFSKWARTDETKKKMSDAKKGKPNIKLSIPVYQYTLDGEFVKKWDSAAEANRNGFLQSKVNLCCLGKRKKHKGFQWSYNLLN